MPHKVSAARRALPLQNNHDQYRLGQMDADQDPFQFHQ